MQCLRYISNTARHLGLWKNRNTFAAAEYMNRKMKGERELCIHTCSMLVAVFSLNLYVAQGAERISHADALRQDSSQQILYTPDFRFRDGIFVNFDQVRQNNPISKSRLISKLAYDDPDFFSKLLDGSDRLQYFDNLGTVQEVPEKELWGYADRGILYIALNDGYFRVNIIGNICHFIASQTTYSNYTNPYYPYYSPYNYYSYYPYYYNQYPGNASTEMRQYLIDFRTGNILDYDVESVEVLLMSDPELHDEYAALKKKKKKQLKFLYIRKFNERNPLYFPGPQEG